MDTFTHTIDNLGNTSPVFLRNKLSHVETVAQQHLRLKKGFWVYFMLLIFEGALRKWVLPGLSNPLLIVRDPVALWLIFTAWKNGFLPSNPYMFLMALIGVVGIFTAIFLGHGNLFVAIYGARIMLIHFPVIFVLGNVLNQEDVIKLGKVVLWLALPMTILIALQFYSPQSAWVNRGLGNDVNGAGFSGVMDYFRPPATFSFTNGTTLFYGLVSCFVFYFWIDPITIGRPLLIAATLSLLVAIPLSISRGLSFQVGISLFFAMMAISKKPKYFSRLLLAIFTGVLILGFLNKTSFFKTASEVLATRFDQANGQEGGMKGILADRYLGGMVGAIKNSADQPFFGYGLGLGSNAGAMLVSSKRVFLIAEEEWARIIGELGPLMGLMVIFIRLSVSLKMAKGAYRKLVAGNPLPWMLLSFALFTIPQSPWSQPTSLGFSVLIGGLLIGSLQNAKDSNIPEI